MDNQGKHSLDPLMKKNYTNNQLLEKFGSKFELVNYAIRLAENMIRSGRGPRIKIDSENPSLQVIAEIACNKDHFDEISEKAVETRSFFAATEHVPIKESFKNTSDKPRKKQKVPL